MIELLRRLGGLLGPLAGLMSAVGVGVLVCVVMALGLDVDPIELFSAIWRGAWGSPASAAATIGKVTPLLLTGLAVSLAYQARLLNIGCEGQLTLGALAAASFSVAAPGMPRFLLIPMTLLIGSMAGGAWAFMPIWLRQRRGIHEVVSTLLMNYVAIYLSEYLALGPLGDGTAMGRTPLMPAGATLQPLIAIGAISLTAAPFLAVLLSLIAQLWLSKTCWGYEVLAVGDNPTAATSSGIGVESWQRRLFILSGALAGLAGALEVSAVHHRFYNAFSPGYGFDGITAAFLVNAAPGWLWLSVLMLASLRASDKWLQLALGVSPNALLIIQAVMLLAVACQGRLRSMGRQILSAVLRTARRGQARPI